VYWLLVLVTVFGPMAIAAYVVIAGGVGRWARLPWLVGWGYCLVPACYLSFQGLCEDMSGTCPSDAALSDAERARVALAALVLAILVLGVSRAVRSLRGAAWAAVVFAVLVAFAEVWMFLRLRDAGLGFTGVLCLLALAWGIATEVVGVRTARRVAAEAVAPIDPGGPPAPGSGPASVSS
jgi:hypothetical protein